MLAEAAMIKSGNGNNFIMVLVPPMFGFFLTEAFLFKESK